MELTSPPDRELLALVLQLHEETQQKLASLEQKLEQKLEQILEQSTVSAE